MAWSLVGIFTVAGLAVRGLREPVPLPLLAAHAVHGFVLVVGYPFERIRQLATR